MPGTSTIYDIKVKYSIDGEKASGGLKDIARHADKAGEGIFSLKHAMEALAIREVFHAGKEALIGFNSEIDQMKIGMTTVMQMNLHMPFEKANKEADKLFETFQQLAKKSPLTTKDFMEMATAISPAIALAGGGPEKLAKITQGALTAGLAYGQRPDIVAMDVQEMMMGNVTKRNRLGNELLGSIGMGHEDFNKKSAQERAQLVEKMFSQEGLQKAADRFGETFQGQVSTLKDNLQIALGQVGRPLMEAMTAEVKKWNDFLDKHPKLIKETVTELSDMIKGAFTFVQSVASFLIDNRDILLTIGKTFLVFKGAQLAGNIFKKFADGLDNLSSNVKTASAGFVTLFQGGGLSGFGGGISGVFGLFSKAIPVIGGFISAIQLASTLLDVFNTHREQDLLNEKRRKDIHEAVGDIPELFARRQQLQATLAGKGLMGTMVSDPAMRTRFETELETVSDKLFDPAKIGEALRKMSDESKEHSKGKVGFENLSMEQFAHLSRQLPSIFDYRNQEETLKVTNEMLTVAKLFENLNSEMKEQVLKNAFPEQFGKPDMSAPKTPEPGWNPTSKPEVNITIQKIEVASEDPDRFVFGLAKIGEQATKHPTQSQHTVPGGF